MHREILTKEQIGLLPLLEKMRNDFGLVGGTAIALHIGHRRSIDFDLFSYKKFKNTDLKLKIQNYAKISEIIVDKLGELTFMCNKVKFTFYHFHFEVPFGENFDGIIRMPDLVTLSAMKAFALGQRAKWKDYVDLYFVLEQFYDVVTISKQARKIFNGEFNEKLFRLQLSYFTDVNYEEEVEFLPGFAVSDRKIKASLMHHAVS